MSKKKILSWLLSLCLLGGLVAMPGVAGASSVGPTTPEMMMEWENATDPNNWNIKWTVDLPSSEGSGGDGEYGLWLHDPAHNGLYGMGMTGFVGQGQQTGIMDVSQYITVDGTYTAGFRRPGLSLVTPNDYQSAASITRAYTKPGAVFGTPKSPAWDGTKATWTVPTDAVVPTGNARYLVELNAVGDNGWDGTYFSKEVALTNLEAGVEYGADILTLEEEFPGRVYYFTVRVLSDKIGTTAHSALATSSRILKDGTPVGGGTTPDPDPEKLPAPTAVTFNADYTVDFAAVADARSYTVQLYRGAVGSGTKVGSSRTVTATTANLSDLVTTAGNYYVGVVAVSADGAAYNSSEAFSGIQAYVERLPAPATLAWNDDWSVSFGEVANAKSYTIQLYKGALGAGVKVGSGTSLTAPAPAKVLAEDIGLATLGDYYVGVVAVHADDADLNSLEAFTAVRTLAKLGTPGGLRWEKTASGYAAAWNAATGIAAGDEYEVIVYNAGGTQVDTATVAGTANQAVFTLAEGSYTFTVQAIHSEFAFADGDASGKSPVQNVLDDSAIDDVIDEILEDLTDATAARNALNNLDQAALASAMQGNESLREDIQKIEDAYADEKTIVVDHDVETGLGFVESEVTIIGAGFSAISNSTIGVHFTKPAQNAAVDLGGYTNPVQVDIDLIGKGGLSITPVTPITITMPIPAGMSAQNLVILHVLRSGKIERIVPKINGDGTVTFTVTSFSPFIFANKVRQSGPSYDHDWSQDLPTVAPPPQEWKPGSPSLTAPVPSAPSTNFYRVLARSLNQRGGPGTNYPIMGKLTQNALIQIVGFSEDGQWAQTSAGTWLSMAYLSGTNAASGTGNYVVSVSSSLNVRSGPGTGSSTIGKLYAGASVRALSVENGWALIEYNGGMAYVSAMYLR